MHAEPAYDAAQEQSPEALWSSTVYVVLERHRFIIGRVYRLLASVFQGLYGR